MERVSDDKIEDLKRYINGLPGNYEVYKRALICLIESSKCLSEPVCICTRDSGMIREFETAHPKLYVSQHNPSGLAAYLLSKDFAGRFGCELSNYGKECLLYWSPVNKPIVGCSCKVILFGDGAGMTLLVTRRDSTEVIDPADSDYFDLTLTINGKQRPVFSVRPAMATAIICSFTKRFPRAQVNYYFSDEVFPVEVQDVIDQLLE